jgi:hypothetical protein
VHVARAVERYANGLATNAAEWTCIQRQRCMARRHSSISTKGCHHQNEICAHIGQKLPIALRGHRSRREVD